MSYYEMLYIVSSSVSDEERENLIAKLRELVEKSGGAIENENSWGMRSLAYPIKHETKGFYVLNYLELPESTVKELKYFFKVNEGFLRAMILKKKRKLSIAAEEEVKVEETKEKEEQQREGEGNV